MPTDRPSQPTATPDQTQLALERTFLAHERTLMAWIRTSVAMITLGFSLYKFFIFLQAVEPDKHPQHVFGIRSYGLLMIGLGVGTLAIATRQHRRDLKRLSVYYHDAPGSLSTLLALVIIVVGILAFASTAFWQ